MSNRMITCDDSLDHEIAKLELRLKATQARLREMFWLIDECEVIRHALATLRVAKMQRDRD